MVSDTRGESIKNPSDGGLLSSSISPCKTNSLAKKDTLYPSIIGTWRLRQPGSLSAGAVWLRVRISPSRPTPLPGQGLLLDFDATAGTARLSAARSSRTHRCSTLALTPNSRAICVAGLPDSRTRRTASDLYWSQYCLRDFVSDIANFRSRYCPPYGGARETGEGQPHPGRDSHKRRTARSPAAGNAPAVLGRVL